MLSGSSEITEKMETLEDLHLRHLVSVLIWLFKHTEVFRNYYEAEKLERSSFG